MAVCMRSVAVTLKKTHYEKTHHLSFYPIDNNILSMKGKYNIFCFDHKKNRIVLFLQSFNLLYYITVT